MMSTPEPVVALETRAPARPRSATNRLAFVAAGEEISALLVQRDAARPPASVGPLRRAHARIEIDRDRHAIPQVRVRDLAARIDHQRFRTACDRNRRDVFQGRRALARRGEDFDLLRSGFCHPGLAPWRRVPDVVGCRGELGHRGDNLGGFVDQQKTLGRSIDDEERLRPLVRGCRHDLVSPRPDAAAAEAVDGRDGLAVGIEEEHFPGSSCRDQHATNPACEHEIVKPNPARASRQGDLRQVRRSRRSTAVEEPATAHREDQSGLRHDSRRIQLQQPLLTLDTPAL